MHWCFSIRHTTRDALHYDCNSVLRSITYLMMEGASRKYPWGVRRGIEQVSDSRWSANRREPGRLPKDLRPKVAGGVQKR